MRTAATTEKRVQTAFRFRPDLIVRIKREAAMRKCSVNTYVEHILEKATEPDWPALPDIKDIDNYLDTTFCCSGMLSPEEIEADPRLSHILAV